MVPAELAAVIAGADTQRAAFGAEFDDRGEPGAHRLGDGGAGEAVDDDFEHRGDLGAERAATAPFKVGQ